MDQDDFAKPQLSAPAYGRSLTGVGFNLIVKDIERAIIFAKQVLGAEVFFRTDVFAAMRLSGQDFMFHTPSTYRNNALYATLVSDAPRGVGIELRCYHVDPDRAEARARELGFAVLAATIDKGKDHGLRECVLLDDDGYVWIPSCHSHADANT